MKKDGKQSKKEHSTGMLLACYSQVIILYVHHLNLAEKFFVGDIWRVKVEMSRITPPYLMSLTFRRAVRVQKHLFVPERSDLTETLN